MDDIWTINGQTNVIAEKPEKDAPCEISGQIGNHLDESFREKIRKDWHVRRVRERCRNRTWLCGSETGLRGPPPLGRFNDPVRLTRISVFDTVLFLFLKTCCFVGIEQQRTKKIRFPVAHRLGH